MSTTPEGNAIDNIITVAKGIVRKRIQRDAHPKAHGCVTAEFIVDPAKLPEQARCGVFQRARTFNAWIRFSNADSQPQADGIKDVRGMAIKLLGIDGKNTSEDEPNAQTQDFILISHEVFFARTALEFITVLAIVGQQITDPDVIKKFEGALKILGESQENQIRNPLGGTYWSTVPFRLGPHQVKYRARALDGVVPPPDISRPNFLREAMEAYLEKNAACFEFAVQFFRDEASTPIEDPTVRWDTPFVPVATIVIRPQKFTTPEREEFCENLSFTPWHSLREHEPLGAINQARQRIYDTLSDHRHQLRNVPRTEPTG